MLSVLIFVKIECGKTGRIPPSDLCGHIFFSFRTQRQKRARQKKLSEVVLVVVNPHEDKRGRFRPGTVHHSERRSGRSGISSVYQPSSKIAPKFFNNSKFNC